MEELIRLAHKLKNVRNIDQYHIIHDKMEAVYNHIKGLSVLDKIYLTELINRYERKLYFLKGSDIDKVKHKVIDDKYFFDTLDGLYNPELNKDGNWKHVKYAVKYSLQASIFSYEIHTQDTAFTGKPIFTSKVFGFWRSNMEEIINDIFYHIIEEPWVVD